MEKPRFIGAFLFEQAVYICTVFRGGSEVKKLRYGKRRLTNNVKSEISNPKSEIPMSEIKPLEPEQDNACEGKSKKFSYLVCTLRRQLLTVHSATDVQYIPRGFYKNCADINP